MKKTSLFLICFVSIICGYMLTWCADVIWHRMHEKRILVMISSWKRPLLLSGQIIRFEKQTYHNFRCPFPLLQVHITILTSAFR